ncbi:MAG: 6-carboxytetrahydropterin synthase [Pirellulaceae bacterium]
MSLTIMRRIKFCAGHRLFEHGGKCEHFHGHNYVADILVTGDTVDSVGRVLDADLKAHRAGSTNIGIIAFGIRKRPKRDYCLASGSAGCRLFKMPYNPTAENMARYLLEEMCPQVLEGTGARATSVRIWETDEAYAEASVL